MNTDTPNNITAKYLRQQLHGEIYIYIYQEVFLENECTLLNKPWAFGSTSQYDEFKTPYCVYTHERVKDFITDQIMCTCPNSIY